MENKALGRLETLQKLNSDRTWVNKDLYRMLYKEDLFVVAYERIKSRPSSMCPGTDGETLDGTSLGTIRRLIEELRDETFRFNPVRRKESPKANGKSRTLGIPAVRDRLVQEVMKMILEAVYESPEGPFFLDTSHGFRPKRSCHTALREFRRKWSGVNWIIEGDVKACFDQIDHRILTDLLRKKIHDERFISLVWKFLRAGKMEELCGPRLDSLVGTPQGGVVSPILANVYLHELDSKVEEIRLREERGGSRKRRNPEYHRLVKLRAKLIRKGDTPLSTIRDLEREIRQTPSIVPNDPDFIKVKYIRYADGWIIGVSGPKTMAEGIGEEIETFLRERLRLTLNPDKSRITHAKKELTRFLGCDVGIGRGTKVARAQKVTQRGKRITKRVAGWQPTILAPVSDIVERLHARQFCDANGFPTHKGAYIALDPDQIVRLYSGINRGIQNYYRFVDNFSAVQRIQYILQYSCAKTLAAKYRLSLKQIFAKYGPGLTIHAESADGRGRTVSFYLNRDWTRKPDAFQLNNETIDRVNWFYQVRSRSRLGWPCAICGTEDDVEMHHLKHIRKVGTKKPAGFAHIMARLNRKQIPVCRVCHSAIHAGRYDQIRLGELAHDPR